MTMTIRRRRILRPWGAGAIAALPTAALAQELDGLKILVGFPPGGSADVVARHLAEKLMPAYTRNAIVDNRPGAAGRIAIDALRAAPPTAARCCWTPASTVTVYADIYRNLSYNPFTDLVPVSLRRPSCTASRSARWCRPRSPTSRSLPSGRRPIRPKPVAATRAKARSRIPHAGAGQGARRADPAGALSRRRAGAERHAGQPARRLMLPDGSFLPYGKDKGVRVLATSGEKRSPFLSRRGDLRRAGVKELVGDRMVRPVRA